MQGSLSSFASALLIAILAIMGPHAAEGQDMPPILAPLAPPTPPAATATPAPVAPSGEAVIPSVTPPAKHIASTDHPATARRNAKSASIKNKFAALTRRLTAAGHARRKVSHVVARAPQPAFPPGAPVPPPGYFPPSPYRQLVYGGPPVPIYGGWNRYPYYP